MSSFRSILPSVSKAPANQHTKAKFTATELKAKVAHAVITECLDQTQTNGFTTRDIFEAVAEVKAAYETPNALGTCLGSGLGATQHARAARPDPAPQRTGLSRAGDTREPGGDDESPRPGAACEEQSTLPF